jgi:regulator of protease activity HflC (stomatin/prohibitin superfamily)
MRTLFIAIALFSLAGCGAVVEPGHRALLFDPRNKGLHPEVLGPGYYHLGAYGRLEDFDVTYSTHKEDIQTTSSEGLTIDIHLACIYRPVVSELYELDTEIGLNYYDEVVGPELRSAARGVFARHSYTELSKKNEKIEDEIEGDLRRRIKGKHVDIASITMEAIQYAPEIAAADRSKLIAERESSRQKAQIENDALKAKLAFELSAQQSKVEAERAAERARADAARQAEADRIEAERAVRSAQNARVVAEEDTKTAKAQAQASLIHARAEAEQRVLLAHATAEEKRAEAQATTWLEVQKTAYEALGKLGGGGTHILIGDWAKLPNFLFPRMGGGMVGNPYATAPTFYAPDGSSADGPTKPIRHQRKPVEVVNPYDE